jgi:serine/threonine-protein kinase RsbW
MNSISVRASLEHLSELIEHVTRISIEHSATPEQIMSIELAVEEVVVNVISYAYTENSQGKIKLSCYVNNEQLIISISDWGIPYNPLLKEAPDVDALLDDRPVGGLGIFLTKQVMDKVEYEYRDAQNILTLTKNLKND